MSMPLPPRKKPAPPESGTGRIRIYANDGSDAIAGVVNFKLRRDYRDAEVNVEYGNTTDKDSGEFAASLGEARAVMVEGESGLLAICPLGHMPTFEPSLRRVTWPNGAQATLYSAGEPEALRGPQNSHACRGGAEGGLCQ